MEHETAAEWEYKLVDLSDNGPTTVYASPCLYRGAIVTTVMSAHDILITDDSVNIGALAASSAVGASTNGYDVRVLTKLTVEPNASSTGIITVIYKPYHDGQAGTGYSGADNGL